MLPKKKKRVSQKGVIFDLVTIAETEMKNKWVGVSTVHGVESQSI